MLVIDASRSGLWGHFSEYFSLKPTDLEVETCPSAQLISQLELLTCAPQEIRGRLRQYQCRWSPEMRALVDADSGCRLSFDFSASYSEDLLVHHQAGGGSSEALALLKKLTFNTELAKECRETLQLLGNDYDAIHVRNSDYKTDWKPFIERVADELASDSVLVCSDDRTVILFCIRFFADKRVLITTIPPDTGGKALHTHESIMSPEERRSVIRDGLIDLIALANGKSLRYQNTINGHPSGYSELAKHLHNDKSVVDALLSSSPQNQSPVASSSHCT